MTSAEIEEKILRNMEDIIVAMDSNVVENKIREKIKETSGSYQPDEEILAFIEAFKTQYGDNLEAVIFYGSCLASAMRKPSSFRDFFVLVREYASMSKGFVDRLLLPLIPPNLYFISLDKDGNKIDAKYHVLTTKEFARMASRFAPDHYIIGRMCKRVALVWAKNKDIRDVVLEAIAESFFSNVRITLPLIDSAVDYHGLVISFLRTSYMSELRMETAEKIEQIYQSEKEYYDVLYSMLKDVLVDSGQLTSIDGKFYFSGGGKWEKQKAFIYLWKSKIRHVARFPKMIRAMDNWLEQLLGKFERTYGKKLELTDFEKKHRFYTVIKYFYKIKIKGEN